jgi:hypothetical protein
VPPDRVSEVKRLMPSDEPLDISVVSYTKVEALAEDATKTKCIPFLGHLVGLAYVEHRVLVFEGHPSAFEAGVRGCDVLIIDSAMGPFLQEDWLEVARRAMAPGHRILVHDRESYALKEIAPGAPVDWRQQGPGSERRQTLLRGRPAWLTTNGALHPFFRGRKSAKDIMRLGVPPSARVRHFLDKLRGYFDETNAGREALLPWLRTWLPRLLRQRPINRGIVKRSVSMGLTFRFPGRTVPLGPARTFCYVGESHASKLGNLGCLGALSKSSAARFAATPLPEGVALLPASAACCKVLCIRRLL